MADDRIKDLPEEVIESELNALIATLYLAVDDTTFTDANKILLKAILFEELVDDNTNDFQALTPKGFYDSVMTTVRMGIQRLATNGEVTAKTGVGLLNTAHQVLMQTQWVKDWFESSGVPNIYGADDLTTPSAMSFEVNFNQANMTAGQEVAISPVLPSGYRYHTINFSWAASVSTGVLQGSGFSNMVFSGSTVSTTLIILASNIILQLRLSADGREISIYAINISENVLASLHFNVVIQPIS